MAESNAAESFKSKIVLHTESIGILEGLKKELKLKNLPLTIECFDISNIQGTNAVVSLVRFTEGSPDKDRYRRYRIKTVQGPDDYASMYEVLNRRFKRSLQEGWELPDLIMIDGGKGQLNIAARAAEKLGYLDKADMISIAKGKKEGETDKIYVHGTRQPNLLPKFKEGLYFLMRVRDEAHRFAIEYHKRIRLKKLTSSGLDNIQGIGRKRRKELLNHFGSLRKIKSATAEEIASLPGISDKLAREIKKNIS